MNDNNRKALELVKKATIRHIRPAGVHFMPGFREMELDTEVKLHQWRLTMHKGLYFVADADSDMPGSVKRYLDDPSEGLVLYTASVSVTEEELKELVTDYAVTDEVDDQGSKDQAVIIKGTEEQAQKLGLRFEMKPVTVSDGHKVTMNELGVWLAIKDAKEAKDEEALKLLHEEMFERLAPEPTEELPRQASEPIRHIQKGVSKLSDPLNWPGIMQRGGAALKVNGEKEAPRHTVVRVGNDETQHEAISPFTGIGESVHNAIASLAVADYWEFALTDVAKLVYGTRTTPSAKQLREVESSIDRMAITPITVDWSAEARNGELEFNGEKVTNFKHSATILAIEKISIQTKNGSIAKGYHLLSMPLIHRHDMETKQFTTVRRNMLEAAAAKVRSTEANIKTREYLLRRIARMKNSSGKAKKSSLESSRNITYDRIMEAREVSNDAKGKNKKAMKEAVKGYLEAFAEDGWIKGFSEYTAKADQKSRKNGGTKATGVTIIL